MVWAGCACAVAVCRLWRGGMLVLAWAVDAGSAPMHVGLVLVP